MGLLESGWRFSMGWFSRYKRRRRRESRAQAVAVARAADLARISAAQTRDTEAHDNEEAHIISSPAGTEYTQNSKGVWCKNHSSADVVGSKTYTHYWSGYKNVGSGNAVVCHTFPVQTIQAGKAVEMYLRLPARADTGSWGGLYVNINVRVNGGTWYNLGNSGYDGAVMASSASMIATSHHHKYLDFIANAGVSASSDYTIQFELVCRSYNSTTKVGNASHDINRTANNLASRGALATWGSNQNYTNLILREVSR